MSKVLDKCCRLKFLLPKEKIATIFKVYGDIDYYDNTVEGEPKHGWLTREPTMSCSHLTPGGCQFVLDGKDKPERCKAFPTADGELSLIKTCGYCFQDNQRVGECNRCNNG